MADLGDVSVLTSFVDSCWSELKHVDIWVNCAGVDLLTGPASDWPFSDKLQRLYEVDVRSTLLLSRLAGARMIAADGGVILNIGWDQAERGMEGDSGELFAAAKSAIMGFTRSLAVSLAPKVRVNCLAPGWIRTKWGEGASSVWQERVVRETPLRRWGTPEDVAAVARFLVSREAGYMTGQVIYVNGGAER
jgi:3-oxoacyl-[acyl-carrier protein] reductase